MKYIITGTAEWYNIHNYNCTQILFSNFILNLYSNCSKFQILSAKSRFASVAHLYLYFS